MVRRATAQAHPDAGVRVRRLLHEAKAELGSLTFPSYRPLLARLGQDAGVAAYVAETDRAAAGLALCAVADDGKTAKLLSVAVRPERRRQGIARRLLQALEADLAERCMARIETSYVTRRPGWQAFEGLIGARGWSPPEAVTSYCRLHAAAFLRSPLAQRLPAFPAEFEVFPWVELTARDERAIVADLRSGEVPEHLDPFAARDQLEPITSLGLRHRDSVVAWMVTHLRPGDAGAIAYSRQFAYPPHDRMARGLRLIVESAHRHAASPALARRQLGEFDVATSNVAMHRIFQRHFATIDGAHCFEARSSGKSLSDAVGFA